MYLLLFLDSYERASYKEELALIDQSLPTPTNLKVKIIDYRGKVIIRGNYSPPVSVKSGGYLLPLR